MDAETETTISETVLEILKSSNMDEITEFMVRKSASEKLGMDLSQPIRKKFVRKVVESYLAEQQAKAEQKEESEDEKKPRHGDDGSTKEYDDDGDLIICRLNKKRRVTITNFRGKNLVSLREYYWKDGKELPTSKGISLTAEQWASFMKNLPAIDKAIKKRESRI
nr:RNA polymerase II transcriptional coactivator KELP [Ipomoea batatas]